jgi:hypothetical protein
VVVDLNLLVLGGGSETDISVAVVVTNDDVTFVVLKVEARVDSNASTVQVQALGGLHTANFKIVAGTSNHAKGDVVILVVGIEIDVSRAHILAVDVGTSSNTPARDVGASLSPDGAWEGGDVGGRASSSLNTVAELHVAAAGGGLPTESRVKSIKAIEVSVADRNLQDHELEASYGLVRLRTSERYTH